MADGLKRLLTRSRSKSRTRSRPQISEPLEKGEVDGPPLLFRASAYGDASTGASPVYGLLPLRGNRSYAVRRSSYEHVPSRSSTTPYDSSSSTSRVNRLSKSRSAHASRSTSPERAPQTEPVELPAPTRRPQSEVISGRWNGVKSRSQRSSRQSSPGRDIPPVPPLPTRSPSEIDSAHRRVSMASDRAKRASRQNSWERDGPNSLAAHPPFAQSVASRYNPRRSSQSSMEETRNSLPSKGYTEERESSKAGYPHGSPPTAFTDRDGQPKPLEPAWYLARGSKQRSSSEYERERLALESSSHVQARPEVAASAVELPSTEPAAELEAPPSHPERKRPRTRRSHIQRKRSEGGTSIRSSRKDDGSSQERRPSAGTETRAAVAAAIAAAAAAAAGPAESKLFEKRYNHDVGRVSETASKTIEHQAEQPPESPRDDVSAISWATAEDGESAPHRNRGPARPSDLLFANEPESRQETPRAPESRKDKTLGEEFTPERQMAKERVAEISPPSAHSMENDKDYFHVPGAFPTAEEVVRRAQFNSVNTTVYETVAPVVTHELIIPRTHHIQEEHITREIHNHDVYHRILPIRETVMLPAKHYRVGRNRELIEMRPDDVPHDSNDGWVLLKTVSKEEIPLEPKTVSAQELLAFSRAVHGRESRAIPADESDVV